MRAFCLLNRISVVNTAHPLRAALAPTSRLRIHSLLRIARADHTSLARLASGLDLAVGSAHHPNRGAGGFAKLEKAASLRIGRAHMTTTAHTHRNRLADTTSPYLLQHQHNPVSRCALAVHL